MVLGVCAGLMDDGDDPSAVVVLCPLFSLKQWHWTFTHSLYVSCYVNWTCRYETMSEIADHMFPPLKNSPVSRGQPGQELEEREEEEVRQRKRLQYILHVDKQDDNWASPTAVCCSGCNDEPHQITL